jgi:hypothetical protein
LVVIDLDTTAEPAPTRVLREQADTEPTPPYVHDSATALAWLCRRRGGQPEDLQSLTVTTPTGGRHLYFRAPAGVRVTSGAGMTSGLGWGIDVRGWGGYVVVPPSTRPEGAYASLGGVLMPLPVWLLDALADAGRVPGREPSIRQVPSARPTLTLLPGGHTASTAADAELDVDRRHRYLSAAVRGEIERVWHAPAGGLNDTLTRAAFALGQLVAGAGLDAGQAAYALLVAARAASMHHVAAGGKPFDQTKTTGTIARGLAAGAAHPRTVTR